MTNDSQTPQPHLPPPLAKIHSPVQELRSNVGLKLKRRVMYVANRASASPNNPNNPNSAAQHPRSNTPKKPLSDAVHGQARCLLPAYLGAMPSQPYRSQSAQPLTYLRDWATDPVTEAYHLAIAQRWRDDSLVELGNYWGRVVPPPNVRPVNKNGDPSRNRYADDRLWQSWDGVTRRRDRLAAVLRRFGAWAEESQPETLGYHMPRCLRFVCENFLGFSYDEYARKQDKPMRPGHQTEGGLNGEANATLNDFQLMLLSLTPLVFLQRDPMRPMSLNLLTPGHTKAVVTYGLILLHTDPLTRPHMPGYIPHSALPRPLLVDHRNDTGLPPPELTYKDFPNSRELNLHVSAYVRHYMRQDDVNCHLSDISERAYGGHDVESWHARKHKWRGD